MNPPVDDFLERRQAIRQNMGGSRRVESVHAAGKRTARERIDYLLDEMSFLEVGTFSRSERDEVKDSTPGDGKIGGHGLIGGRHVTVVADDVTVKRATSAVVASRRLDRLYEQALNAATPFVFLADSGGGRIPDIVDSEGFSRVTAHMAFSRRNRSIPMVTAVLGDSYGGSSFLAALSDFVIQVRGSALSVTSPSVIRAATGEEVSKEELGGADLHAAHTGQVDLIADSEEQALAAVRRFLSFLPQNRLERPPASEPASPESDQDPLAVVPERRNLGYDVRDLIRAIVDKESLFVFGSSFGPGLLTGLCRISGRVVGIVASQPQQRAGTLDPESCDKAVRMLCLCDSFGIPVLFVQDTPGFLVGRTEEHNRLLAKAVMLQTALGLSASPKFTLIVRKGFGLAYYVLGGGSGMGADMVCAWPGAEIGFMDPAVARSVVGSGVDEDLDVSPYGPAGIMNIDEIIHPNNTRDHIVRWLDRLPVDHAATAGTPLSTWPTRW